MGPVYSKEMPPELQKKFSAMMIPLDARFRAATREVKRPLGARVTFVNNDTKAHYMHSDPHPDATDCPAFNQVGLLAATQKRE